MFIVWCSFGVNDLFVKTGEFSSFLVMVRVRIMVSLGSVIKSGDRTSRHGVSRVMSGSRRVATA